MSSECSYRTLRGYYSAFFHIYLCFIQIYIIKFHDDAFELIYTSIFISCCLQRPWVIDYLLFLCSQSLDPVSLTEVWVGWFSSMYSGSCGIADIYLMSILSAHLILFRTLTPSMPWSQFHTWLFILEPLILPHTFCCICCSFVFVLHMHGWVESSLINHEMQWTMLFLVMR